MPYDGVQYTSEYLPRRAAYLENEGTRRVVWSIHYLGWSTRIRESESLSLDDRKGGPARARRYTCQEELEFQLGRDAMIKLTGEETSKQMKARVARRAARPGLAKVIANATHERRVQAHGHSKATRVGKDTQVLRFAGITGAPESRRRHTRVVAAPGRLSLTFGPDSAQPSEFKRPRELGSAQGTGETPNQGAGGRGNQDQTKVTVTQQNTLLSMLL